MRRGGCRRGAWRAGRPKQGTVARWVGGLWGSRAPAQAHAQGCSWVGRLTDVRPGSPEGTPRTVVRSGLGGFGAAGKAAPRGRSLPVVRDVGWIQRECTEGTRHWVELWEGVRGALSAHERYLNTGTQAEKRKRRVREKPRSGSGPNQVRGNPKKGPRVQRKLNPQKKVQVSIKQKPGAGVRVVAQHTPTGNPVCCASPGATPRVSQTPAN